VLCDGKEAVHYINEESVLYAEKDVCVCVCVFGVLLCAACLIADVVCDGKK
jgi:hypothetical protein